jgi:hypothetical protein
LVLLGLMSGHMPACQIAPNVIADYREIPFHPADTVLKGEQRDILSSFGVPQFVWVRHFDLYEWVYCVDGVPDRRFIFDIRGQLLRQVRGGDEQLCAHFAWAPILDPVAQVFEGPIHAVVDGRNLPIASGRGFVGY